MKTEIIKQKINENPDIFDFAPYGKGISDEWISQAEERLDVKFPFYYKWWLKKYSRGSIHGEEVFSIYEINFDEVRGGDIVYINELSRKNKFTDNTQLIIQKNDQGEVYYFDLTATNSDGSCPIYILDSNLKYAKDFLHFIEKKMNE